MVLLQEEYERKEAAKLQGIRDRAKERTVRFMNARERQIGIHKDSLDIQVREKENARLKELHEKEQEAEYMNSVIKFAEQEEIAAKEERQRQLDDVKQTLMSQKMMPKNNAIKKGTPIDLETCTASSIQRFSGEDLGFHSRKLEQQKELQSWCSSSIQNLKDRQLNEMNEKQEYADYVLKEDYMRTLMAREEEDQKKRLLIEIKDDNLRQARENKMKREQQLQREKEQKSAEVSHAMNEPFLTEDTEQVHKKISSSAVCSNGSIETSESGRGHFRPDHYKGFTKDQIQYLLSQNETILREKEMMNDQIRQEEENYAQYQSAMLEEMELAEYERQQQVLRDNKNQAQIHNQQRKELKEKQDYMKRDRFGEIGEGFFQKFGQSCR